ncbi:MAG: hypothetical protein KDD89_13480 [Anaerolineales bacterium]|nr:hypothetical protein [Anaerolineales bacterium]
MSQLHQLYRLQLIDSDLQESKKQLVMVLNAQKEPAGLAELRARATAAGKQMQTLRAQQKDLELQVAGVASKMKKSEDRLYSGKVRNPKELEDLEQSVAALKRQSEGLEEQLLGVMMALETAEEEHTAVLETVAKREDGWSDKLRQLKKEQMEIAMQVNALTQQRAEQLKQVETAKLTEYEQIRRKKGGVAVSRVKQNMCERCRTGLPEALIREVNQGGYRHCPSCGRILAPVA